MSENLEGKVYVLRTGQYPRDAVRVERVEDGKVHFSPLGGGFMYSQSEADFARSFRVHDPKAERLQYRQAQIGGDHVYGAPYLAYVDGRLWNGWAMPMFPRESAERMMRELDGIRYDGDQDAFIVDFGGDFEPEVYTPEQIVVDGEPIIVFSIGSGSWCWEVVE